MKLFLQHIFAHFCILLWTLSLFPQILIFLHKFWKLLCQFETLFLAILIESNLENINIFQVEIFNPTSTDPILRCNGIVYSIIIKMEISIILHLSPFINISQLPCIVCEVYLSTRLSQTIKFTMSISHCKAKSCFVCIFSLFIRSLGKEQTSERVSVCLSAYVRCSHCCVTDFYVPSRLLNKWKRVYIISLTEFQILYSFDCTLYTRGAPFLLACFFFSTFFVFCMLCAHTSWSCSHLVVDTLSPLACVPSTQLSKRKSKMKKKKKHWKQLSEKKKRNRSTK